MRHPEDPESHSSDIPLEPSDTPEPGPVVPDLWRAGDVGSAVVRQAVEASDEQGPRVWGENAMEDASPVETASYDPIVPTALLTAGWRSYSGIPLSSEIYAAARAYWDQTGLQLPELFEPEKHGPALEIRHRVTDQLIEEAGNTQVLDIAAGLTPRGLLMAHRPDHVHVELDLPVVTELKSRIIETMRGAGVPEAGNLNRLHLKAGNALDRGAVMRAVEHLDLGTPTTVVTEGLLHYLTPPERAVLAENIRAVLLRSGGGVWITDMPTWEGISEEDRTEAQITSAISARDVARNRFETHEDARNFFAEHGLVVTGLRSFLTVVDELDSPRNLGVPLEEVREMNRPWSMWKFELAD